MITRVLISGLSKETVARIDCELGGTSWRHDIRENGEDVYDVDVANCCDVMYTSRDDTLYAVALSVGVVRVHAGLKRDEFNSIIAG